MRESERVMHDLGEVLSASFFCNHLLEIVSKNYVTLVEKCFEVAGEDNQRLRKLNSATHPVSRFRFYLAKLSGYTEI